MSTNRTSRAHSQSRRPGVGRLLGAGLALAAALVSTGAVQAQTAGATRGTTLTLSQPQEPPNWNYWSTGASALSMPTFHNVLEPLLERLPDGSVGPLLATSWDISPDGLTYTFTLREAKFHDGSTLDAEDVVYSLLRNKESPNSLMKTPLAPVVAVEAVDARTVRLKLGRTSQRLLPELGLAAGVIVPKGIHEQINLDAGMIGTGPYVFGAYRPDVDLQLTRFADYWGDKPFFETVRQRFIPDENAAFNALLAGEIDMIGTVLGEGLDRIESVVAEPAFKVERVPLEINYVFLTTKNEALRDLRVRQAIAHAIEREDLALGGQSGFGEPICQYVSPPTEPWNNGYCPYPHDPDKAKALLAEAGHSALTLDFPYLTIAEFPAIREILEVQLAAVGITLKSRPMDLATWLQQVNTNSEYEIGNITTPAKAEAFICKGGRQPLGRDDSVLCDEKFDALAVSADSQPTREAYVTTMAEMVKVMADSAWVIPLHVKVLPTVARQDLVGFKATRFRIELDFRRLRWAD